MIVNFRPSNLGLFLDVLFKHMRASKKHVITRTEKITCNALRLRFRITCNAGLGPEGRDRGGDRRGRAGPRRRRSVGRRHDGRSAKLGQKCCSFSAVSAPIFAGNYAFCSIFQNRPDYLAEIFEICQNFKCCKF